jgi:hypothetical protein
VLPVSTTTISSAQRTLDIDHSTFCSSLNVMTQAEIFGTNSSFDNLKLHPSRSGYFIPEQGRGDISLAVQSHACASGITVDIVDNLRQDGRSQPMGP